MACSRFNGAIFLIFEKGVSALHFPAQTAAKPLFATLFAREVVMKDPFRFGRIGNLLFDARRCVSILVNQPGARYRSTALAWSLP